METVLKKVEAAFASQSPRTAYVHLGQTMYGDAAIVVDVKQEHLQRAIAVIQNTFEVTGDLDRPEPLFECDGRMVIVRNREAFNELSFRRR
jgi:hypothetical protein